LPGHREHGFPSLSLFLYFLCKVSADL